MDKARRCTLRALVALVLCGACLNRLCKNGSNPTVPTKNEFAGIAQLVEQSFRKALVWELESLFQLRYLGEAVKHIGLSNRHSRVRISQVSLQENEKRRLQDNDFDSLEPLPHALLLRH